MATATTWMMDGDMSSDAIATPMNSTSTIASMALALTGQEWTQLGHGDSPNVAASTDLDLTVNRLLSLFLVRIVALISHREFLETGRYIYILISPRPLSVKLP